MAFCPKTNCVPIKPDEKKNNHLALYISLAVVVVLVLLVVVSIFLIKKKRNGGVEEIQMQILPRLDNDSFENISL